jgi:hypothetical protein
MSLPLELVYHIIAYVSENEPSKWDSLKPLSLVNRRLHEMCLPLLWSVGDISLSKHNSHRQCAQLTRNEQELFLTKRIANPHTKRFIRHVAPKYGHFVKRRKSILDFCFAALLTRYAHLTQSGPGIPYVHPISLSKPTCYGSCWTICPIWPTSTWAAITIIMKYTTSSRISHRITN